MIGCGIWCEYWVPLLCILISESHKRQIVLNLRTICTDANATLFFFISGTNHYKFPYVQVLAKVNHF